MQQPAPQYFRDSYHTYEGSLLGMGPRLANVQGPIDLLDIAPSLLTILGHEVPSVMSGKPTLAGGSKERAGITIFELLIVLAIFGTLVAFFYDWSSGCSGGLSRLATRPFSSSRALT
jgi:hypothetical protein